MRLVALSVIGLVLLPAAAADAQAARPVARVGILCMACYSPASGQFPPGAAFLDELQQLGYVSGQAVRLDDRYIGTSHDRLADRAADLVRGKMDVVLVTEAAGVRAVRNATTTTRIVMLGVPDAVRLGLVASLARPGGNVTGVTIPLEELITKQLELMREIVPRLSRVGILSNPDNPEHAVALSAVEPAARALGVELLRLVARTQTDFDAAFSGMRPKRTGGLIVLPDRLFYSQGAGLRLLALRERVPTISTHPLFAQGGGLLSFGPSDVEMYRRAAYFVARILKGARPADLPVEQPTRFHLAINAGTARALGLTIPEAVRIRVDEVID
jgi:putative ABC transport system substrate-binding protein